MTNSLPEEIQQAQATINAAIHDPNVPKLYTNGFNIGQGPADIFIVALLGGKPVSIQYMSFNTAKTLVLTLQQVINDLESKTGQPVLSMQEIGRGRAPGAKQ